MSSSSPTRTGSALLAFLMGVFLTLSGFALGIVADRELYPVPAVSPPVIPTVGIAPTDTARAGQLTSTPRPVPTPVPSVTPRPSDPPINTKPAQDTTPAQLKDEFADFWRAFNLMQTTFYYRPLDEQKQIYAAIKGLVNAGGDEYTQFLVPDEAKAYQDAANGNFVGIGVYTEANPDGVGISGTVPGGPAQDAGLKAGDIILAVDGKMLAGLPATDTRDLIRGPEGSVITLSVRRDGASVPISVMVTRKRIIIPAVTLDIQPDGIAHLTLTAFNDHARDELNGAFDKMRDAQVKGIVLDLRDNGGGYVEEARLLLGRFLPKEDVAMLEDRRPTGGQLTPLYVAATGGAAPLDVPLVVLVNGGTASASEITAGALQDYGRATLIGTKTFGKGSEQIITPFPNGASLRVTVANWYTPKQRVIQKAGLIPDVVLEQPNGVRRGASDPQYDKALATLRSKMP